MFKKGVGSGSLIFYAPKKRKCPMPLFKKVADPPGTAAAADSSRRLPLDERLIIQLQPRTPLDNLEAQEFRQLVMKALQGLKPEELKVVELRYQHKKSPGQVASQLGLTRRKLKALEASALRKLRDTLKAYGEL